MPDVPPNRKHLQCLVCSRTVSSLGNLTHHQRIYHGGSSTARSVRRAPRPRLRDGGPSRRPGVGAACAPAPTDEDRSAPPIAPEQDAAGRAGGRHERAAADGGSGQGGAVGGAVDVDDDELAALLAAAAEVLDTAPPLPKRRRRAAGEPSSQRGADADDVAYPSMTTQVRAFFEGFNDAQRAVPLVRPRKRARPGQFDTPRLRALQDYVLEVGASLEHQNKIYQLVHFWEETAPGAPKDDGRSVPLKKTFKTPHAFRQALSDDIDQAVADDGWLSCVLEEGGAEFEALFRSGLHQALARLRDGRNVCFWSGGDKPADPTDAREGPLDGDAFRDCETEVVSAHGSVAFVLGIHLYSDSSVISWSGGTLDTFYAWSCLWTRAGWSTKWVVGMG